jgi:predicted RNase H-like HicB family nuclease
MHLVPREVKSVIREYIQEALERATYELINNPREPYYAEVPELAGVWATGETLEQCRRNLADVIEGWLLLRLRRGLDIPPLGEHRIEVPYQVEIHG